MAIPLRKTFSDRWLVFFLLFQFISQIILMAEWAGGMRMYLRAAAFASSLALLAFLPPRKSPYSPLSMPVIAILVVMATGMLHTDAHLLAGFAHWWLVLAIWAPLFWVGRLNITQQTLTTALGMLWLFNVSSSLMGVLQVYDPARFAPSAEFVKKLLGAMADGLLIELADGRQIFRPFGFSDTPGGAAVAGSFSVIVGTFICFAGRSIFIRVLAALGIFIGMFCMYVCEIRSIWIFTAISLGVLSILQILRGHFVKTITAALIIATAATVAVYWSSYVSGGRVLKRMSSLTEDSAANVYYKNRGQFIERSILHELPKYPLGSGLGRYGMMYSYFGDKRSRDARPLYVEVQLTAWLYDGGLLLIVLGYVTVVTACYTSIRIAVFKKGNRLLADCASVVSALNVGWLAMTFNYPLFLGETGMTFSLLNAVLFAAAMTVNFPRRTTLLAESTNNNSPSIRGHIQRPLPDSNFPRL